MKRKKGDITTEQIVLLIILIASFAVILFLLVRLNFGQTSDEDICHNSVVTRGSNVLPQGSIPLNCKTTYVCITKDGTCEKLSGTYETDKVQSQADVYKLLADKMADCWWIFGEGKINYVGQDFSSQLYCSICSQISFDNSVNFFPNNKIDKTAFYEYLANTTYSQQGTSYLDYLMGLKNAKSIEDSLKQNNNSQFGQIDLGKQYYIMMGIFSQTGITQWTLSGAGVGLIVGGIVGGPIGIIIGGVVGGGGGYFVGNIVKGQSGNSYISPDIVEANSADFDKLRCASIKTLA